MATMAVCSQNVLVLLKWGQTSIEVVDSMPLPKLNAGEIWDLIFSGDNIFMKYRVQANLVPSGKLAPYKYYFQHIFTKYDSIRLQYDQFNIILNSHYIYP